MGRIKGKRGLSRRPGKGAIDQCWLILRQAADSGDVVAAVKLIELDYLMRIVPKGQGMESSPC